MFRLCHYICNQIAQSGIVLLKMIVARAKAVETLGIVSLALKSCRGLDGSCKKKEISHRSENKEAAPISDQVWAEGLVQHVPVFALCFSSRISHSFSLKKIYSVIWDTIQIQI